MKRLKTLCLRKIHTLINCPQSLYIGLLSANIYHDIQLFSFRSRGTEMLWTCCVHHPNAISAAACKINFCKSMPCKYWNDSSLLQHITKPKWQKGRGKFQYCLIHTKYTPGLCSDRILIQGVNTGYIVRYPTATSSKYCVSSSLIVHTRLPWPSSTSVKTWNKWTLTKTSLESRLH